MYHQTIRLGFFLLKTTMPCMQLTSRTTHISRGHQSAISSFPCQSSRQHLTSPSCRISREARRSQQMPRQAAQDNSAFPYMACARCSGARTEALVHRVEDGLTSCLG